MKKMVLIIVCLFIVIGCDLLKKDEVLDDYVSYEYLELGSIDSDSIAYRNMLLTTYSKYLEVMSHYNLDGSILEEDFDKYNYLVLIAEDKYCDGSIDKLKGMKIDDVIDVKFNITASCRECAIKYYLYLVKVSKSELNEEKEVKYTYESTNELYCDK